MTRFIPFLSLILLIGLMFSGCKSNSGGQTGNTGNNDGSGTTQQPEPGDLIDPELGESLSLKYREDAARLCLRDELTRTRPKDADAFLPKESTDFYFKSLKAIYLHSLENGEVPDIVKDIHTFPNPNLQEVLLVLEKDAPFAEKWKNGTLTTGNATIDGLTSKYSLTIKSYRDGGLGPMVTLRSKVYLNTTHLSKELTACDGIRFAEPEAPMGDGNNIESAPGGKNAFGFKFSEGWGDCPSGCINRRYYTFYVSPEGAVQYMGASGAERE